MGGAAVVVPWATATPNSKNICSRPAGAIEINSLAGWSLSFVNECGGVDPHTFVIPVFRRAKTAWRGTQTDVRRRVEIRG